MIVYMLDPVAAGASLDVFRALFWLPLLPVFFLVVRKVLSDESYAYIDYPSSHIRFKLVSQ